MRFPWFSEVFEAVETSETHLPDGLVTRVTTIQWFPDWILRVVPDETILQTFINFEEKDYDLRCKFPPELAPIRSLPEIDRKEVLYYSIIRSFWPQD